MNENVTAVIRSIGERTEGLCRYILSKQLPEKNIFIVSNKYPSTEGTKEVYKIGLREKRKYTLFVDADQLLFPNSIKYLYDLAELHMEHNPKKIFGVKSAIIDKFLMELRGFGCGPILYVTNTLKQAYSFIPDPYKVIRPDSFIINNMKANGYDFIREKDRIALHDYEQYYHDIYKKMVVNARKTSSKCEKLLDRWTDLSEKDKDFAVCLQGYSYGKIYDKPLAIDYSIDHNYQPIYPEKEPIVNFEETYKQICKLKSL